MVLIGSRCEALRAVIGAPTMAFCCEATGQTPDPLRPEIVQAVNEHRERVVELIVDGVMRRGGAIESGVHAASNDSTQNSSQGEQT